MRLAEKRWPTAILATLGAAILLLSHLALFPISFLAQAVSSDGILSAAYSDRLELSQWLLGWCCLAVAAIAFGSPGWHVYARHALFRTTDRVFLAALALCVGALTWAVQFFMFGNMPHVTDAIAHIFQAKILCMGQLYADAPPCYEHFFQHYVVVTGDGRWSTIYPPGHALLLTIFIKLHILHLFGPVCHGLSAVAFVWIISQIYDRVSARLCGLLFLLSPLMLLLGASYMSHISLMFLSLTGIALLVGSLRAAAPRIQHLLAMLSGLSIAWALLTRPQDLVLIAASGLLVFIVAPGALRRRLIARTPFLVVGALLPTAFLLQWNHVHFGSAMSVGYGLSDAQVLTPHMKPSFGLSDSFTLGMALNNFVWTLDKFNKVLFGWPSSLILIPFALFARRLDVRDIVCTLSVIGFALFYFFYFYYGAEYEARFYAVIALFCMILTVRGAYVAVNLISTSYRSRVTSTLCNLALVFVLHSFTYYWPAAIWPRYAHAYEQASPDLHRLATASELGQAVVLVPSEGEEIFRYSSGFYWNSPRLDGDIIYARDNTGAADCLSQAYPDRSIYRFKPAGGGRNGTFSKVH